MSLAKVMKAIKKTGSTNIEATEWRKSIRLTGTAASWEEKIKAGYAAAEKGYKGIINDITVEGIKTDEMYIPDINDTALDGKHFNAVVIGGGIIGSAIARELTRYDITVALFEKEEDVAKHASSRNDGMIHDGFAAKPGTRKAEYNVRGNRLYTKVCEDLGVPFKRPGSMILFSNPFIKFLLPLLYRRAKKNNVDGYSYLSRKEVARREPHLIDNQYGAFLLPSAGVLSPYKMVVAYAENAVQNGAEVWLNTVVNGFGMENNSIRSVNTNRGTCTADVIINAAGIWADKIAEYGDDRFFSLHGRKGVDAIMDITTGKYQSTIAAMPALIQANSKTKGGGLVITPEGNILVGPTAKEVSTREDYSTEPADIEDLNHHIDLNTKIDKNSIITYFAGIRACTYDDDFIIEPSEHVTNLVHAAGIQSPGLASAPAIAEDITGFAITILMNKQTVFERDNFNPIRKKIPTLNELPFEKRIERIKENPSYGRIVCRCEEISEGEIRDALRSPLPVVSVDGLKRRVRVGAGRCHGGFCTPRVLEIMSEELGIPMTAIKKKGDKSEYFYSATKGDIDYSSIKLKTIEGGQ